MASAGTDKTQRPPDKCLVSTFVPNPSTERGVPTQLGFHPKEPKLIYGAGKVVIVRHLENPKDVLVYRGHNERVTVARFSPNGYWIASGDASGKVRVWSYDNPEHTLKLETVVFGGEVKDLAWDPESKRIVAVGDGRSLFAKVFMWDTGNSVGEIVGHQKRIISVDYRPCRPFRIMTASEDMNVCFYEGPPFKFKHSHLGKHSNFVNAIRYSPDGQFAVSVGSDRKAILYDGKSGELVKELSVSHAGSIYAVSWSPDSKLIATASGDKTVKVWDVASDTLVVTYTISPSPQVSDMQNGIVWGPGGVLVSLSLSGHLNLLDKSNTSKPKRIVYGHQVTIESLSFDASTGTLLSGSYDGLICAWNGQTARPVASHKGKVTSVSSFGNGKFVSVGWDDVARISTGDGSSVGEVTLAGQPSSVAAAVGQDLAVVAHSKGLTVLKGEKVVFQSPEFRWTPTSIAMSPEGDEVAVGGKEDKKIHVFSLQSNGALEEVAEISGHRGSPSALSYSPDGTKLAAGDSNREVCVWDRRTRGAIIQGLWTYHTTRVTSLAWAPSSSLLASGSSDESIYLWSVEKGEKVKHLEFTHKAGVTALVFEAENLLVSAGADACINKWDLTLM